MRFPKAAREERLYALYSVALALGLRRGEALALR
jgi:integrase